MLITHLTFTANPVPRFSYYYHHLWIRKPRLAEVKVTFPRPNQWLSSAETRSIFFPSIKRPALFFFDYKSTEKEVKITLVFVNLVNTPGLACSRHSVNAISLCLCIHADLDSILYKSLTPILQFPESGAPGSAPSPPLSHSSSP